MKVLTGGLGKIETVAGPLRKLGGLFIEESLGKLSSFPDTASKGFDAEYLNT